MIDMNSGVPSTRYCFWWKEGNKVRYTYGDEEDEAPGDWTATREGAEEVQRRWTLFNVITKDTEQGILEKEVPVYKVLESTEKGVIVHLNEEYGYREWLWQTGMSTEELIEWWSSLETVNPHFMDPSKTLPGELRRVWGVSPREVVVEVDPVEGGGHIYVQNPSGWSAHLHMDDDSFLRLPGGKTLHHKGFKDERYEEGDPRRGGNRGV